MMMMMFIFFTCCCCCSAQSLYLQLCTLPSPPTCAHSTGLHPCSISFILIPPFLIFSWRKKKPKNKQKKEMSDAPSCSVLLPSGVTVSQLAAMTVSATAFAYPPVPILLSLLLSPTLPPSTCATLSENKFLPALVPSPSAAVV